ncbi:MAG: ABC transporter ATP-binding protein [Elusimicrobiales bacterium]|nr:ABC transporter ATP-binding protein [Elusimicrobiales bacterium]
MQIISAENIDFKYNGEKAINGIDFKINEADFLAILGPNGSGKSTLLKILARINDIQTGSLIVNGHYIESYESSEYAKFFSYVPGDIYTPYDFSVLEIVVMGRSPYLKWWEDYQKKDNLLAMETLESMRISHLAKRSINSLSSGEKQLVFIAQALVQNPGILVLDEPTSHLDIKYKMEIFGLLNKMREEKKITVIIASHDINLVSLYANKALLLNKGKQMFFGRAQDGLTADNISRTYEIEDTSKITAMFKL